MRQSPLILLGLLVLNTTVALGEVRLLTGDANNQLFDRDAIVLDVSADGRLVLFASGPPSSGNPTPGITRGGLYLRNLDTGTLTFVGIPPGGENNNDPTGAYEASMSDDGRFFAWSDTNAKIIWRDSQTHETREVTPNADGACRRPILSADGRYIAFISVARNLVADTTLLPAENRAAVYLYDSQTQQMTVASLTYDGKGLSTGVGPSNAPLGEFDFTADGQFVLFSTDAAGVHPDRANTTSPAWFWSYRRNVTTGEVVVVGRNAAGQIPTGNFTSPRADAHGNRIAFLAGFVGGGGITFVDGYSSLFDIYRKDIATGQVVRVSQTTNGAAPNGFFNGDINISSDGSVVAFGSSSSNFVAEPTDGSEGEGSPDVFRADISGNSSTVTLISKPVTDNGNVVEFSGPYLPGTGAYVGFATADLKSMIGQGSNDSFFKHCVAVGSFTFPPIQAPSLANISTRLQVLGGDNSLIGGFIIRGNEPKKVIVRGIGPSLPVAGKLENPILKLYTKGNAVPIDENDNWVDSPNKQEIIDSTVAPGNDLESAVVDTLAPGEYTAVVSGVNDGTGIGLVEVFDLAQGADSNLVNISTRGFVQTGNDVMIGGMIVLGSNPFKVIIRAIGPSLPVTGKLLDPLLELRDGNGALLMQNDNWRTGGQEQEIIASTVPPTDDAESAIVRTLLPGNYTAVVSGVGNTTGIALVEVFALQ
jgi:hypothetical protein